MVSTIGPGSAPRAPAPTAESVAAGADAPGPQAPGPGTTGSRTPGAAVVTVLALLLAAASAAVAAWRTGAVEPLLLPGISVSDATVLWLLPVVLAASYAAQVLTLGALLAAAGLFAAEGGQLSPAGWYAARTAARAGVVWAVLAAALLPLTTADLLGQSLGALSLRSVLSTALSVGTGQEYLLVALAALVCAVVGATALSRRSVLVGVAAGVVAIGAQAAAGHSSAAGDHQIAVSSLFLHLLGVVAWAGGLVALVLLARRLPTADLAGAARRFSPLAAVAALLVTASGVVNALIRLGPDPGRWTATAYGPLVGVKLLATLVLLAIGAWHRRRTLPALAAGDRRAFVRLAAGEAALFAVVLGLAAALSRTAPPPTGRVESAAEATLGFPMPSPLTALRLGFDVYPEPIFATLAVAAIVGYGLAARRVARAGTVWPGARTLAWTAGWLVVLFASGSGLARYAFVLTAANVGQQLLLTLVAAPLVVLGAPLTLAARWRPVAVEQASASMAVRGATHPVVVLVLFAGTPFLVYGTPLYGWALHHHWWHLLVLAGEFVAAVLFFAVVLGADVLPYRPARHIRLLLLVVAAAAHAGFGVLLTRAGTPLVPAWWSDLGRAWWPDPVADTHAAGALLWSAGTLPLLAVAVALLVGGPRDRRPVSR